MEHVLFCERKFHEILLQEILLDFRNKNFQCEGDHTVRDGYNWLLPYIELSLFKNRSKYSVAPKIAQFLNALN